MKKNSLLLLIALTSVLTVSAAPISPEAALQRVQKQCPQMAKAPGNASWQLGHTFMRPNETMFPAMYLYTSAKDGGFMILAADDAVDPVIAYSDTGGFDPSNMPPALQWWLDGCALTIEQASQAPSRAETEDIVDIIDPDDPNAPWKHVFPLVKTHWNQGYPYYQQCPEINGSHAYTGCVATAMAQVAKVHQWPVAGIGYREYTFTCDGEKYTDGFDYAGTPFEWELMADSYGHESSPASCDAVAALMHGCGVAAQTRYGTSGSGADSFLAAQGMVSWLNFDKGIKWLSRSWFTEDEWSKTIYDELVAGRPVMMGGMTLAGEGHEFVIDGYSSGNYFHINWGWGGIADGYFLLNALNPEEQGIGGSQNNNGYNFSVSILTGIQPPVENSQYATVIYNEDFYTQEPSFDRVDGKNIIIYCGIGSYSLVPVECEFALRLISEDGETTEYVPWQTSTLDPGYFYNYMQVPTTALPVGKWSATPVYRVAEGEWQEMYYNRTKHGNKLDLDVQDKVVKVVGSPIAFTAEFLGLEPADENDTAVMNGHTYNVTYSIRSNGAWNGPLYCLLYRGKVLVAEAKEVEFADATTITETWTLNIPAGLPVLPGEYSIYVGVRTPSNGYSAFGRYDVMIQEDPNVPRPGELVRANWLEFGDATQRYYPGYTYDLRFELTSNGFCEYENIQLALVKDNIIVNLSDAKTLKFVAPETLTEMWTLPISARHTPGLYSIILVQPRGNNQFSTLSNPWNFNILEESEMETKLKAAFTGWVPVEEGDDAMYPGHSYDFSYDIIAEGSSPWHGSVECAVVSPDGECVSSSALALDFYDTESHPVTWTVTLSEDMPVGECELRLVALPNDGEPEVLDARTLVISSGISSVFIDNADAVYYDLQGVRVTKPTPGGVYIRVTPGKAVKVLRF